jgi:hypothetical protein
VPPFEQQPNAASLPPPGTILVRAGVPHRSGQLALACEQRQYAAMVSAGAYWNAHRGMFVTPTASPLMEVDVALDSAGFTAMQSFARRGRSANGIGLGMYPWSLPDYLSLASELMPTWYAKPDFACEVELAPDSEARTWRVRATATLLEATLRQVATWQQRLIDDGVKAGFTFREAQASAWRLLQPPVPVLQGWTCDDYRLSLDLLAEVWSAWEPLYACHLVGVGSVCRRDLRHRTHGIEAIVRVIDDYLPAGIRLHLFGVKGAAIRALRDHPRIASVDSMAYDVGARRAAYVGQHSNTMANRVAHLHRWMERQTRALEPAQLRLPLAVGHRAQKRHEG